MNYEELKEYFDLCKELAIRCLEFRKKKVNYAHKEYFRLDGHNIEFTWNQNDQLYLRTYIDEFGTENIFALSTDHTLPLFCNTSCSVCYIEDNTFDGCSFVNSIDDVNMLDSDDYVDSFFKNGLCTEDEHFQLSLIHPELPEYNIIKRAYEEVLTAPCPELEGYSLYVPFSFKTQHVRKVRRMMIHKVGI